ncbi:MAG: hypothetical protein GQ527_10365 [Bacteroidales bacterium]|nr:hypothetical protein [Bacteroidales bacterium]
MHREEHQETLSSYLNNIQLSGSLNRLVYQKGKQLFEMGHCHLLASTIGQHEYLVIDDYQDFQAQIQFDGKKVSHFCSCLSGSICSHVYAASLQTLQELSRSLQVDQEGAMKYSREGMIKRVLEERQERADMESYQLDFADNIHGEHHLTNEKGAVYQLNFYDFNKRLGYCSCPDYQTNKLETCKHLMYAFNEFELKHEGKKLPEQSYPFLEIFRHPLYDYQISWFYPHQPSEDIQTVLDEYFDKKQLLKADRKKDLPSFIEQIQKYKSIKIRTEVSQYIEDYFEEKSLKELFDTNNHDNSLLLREIFPFQLEGIQFSAARKGSILADEIGMGKSVQAIGTALKKMEVLGFLSTKILCPHYLLESWKEELKKWIPTKIISTFKLESFEDINTEEEIDFLIIDEAQKIDDYDSGLLQQLQRISYKHILLITDSKIETSLVKFYAMAGLIDQHLLTPLWELSYKHCLFDAKNPDSIVGYYNMEQLPGRINEVYLRREKSSISEQFPDANLVIIPIALDQALKEEQSVFCFKALETLRKKRATHFDIIQLKVVLLKLISLGQTTITSHQKISSIPKFQEFRHFISHKLNLQKGEQAVVFAQDESLRHQLMQVLQEERRTVQIIQEDQKEFNKVIQYFITEENLQNTLPTAHHIIYFHLPDKPGVITERTKMLKESPIGVQQNRIYLLKSTQSMEDVLYYWRENKTHLLNQLSVFLSESGVDRHLNLRLKEELIHELTSFVLDSKLVKHETPEVQMDLFGDELTPHKKKETIIKIKENSNLSIFFESILQSYAVFENLDQNIKKDLKSGQLSITEKDGEIVIRIKPAPQQES